MMGCGAGMMMGCGGGAVGGQPRRWTRQHHSFLSAAQVFSGSTAQLKGSTGPLGAGGLVGGGVGGGVGNGVGGTVGAGLGSAVLQPLPIVEQQNSCWAGDQEVSHCAKPNAQSYGSDVASPHNSHRR